MSAGADIVHFDVMDNHFVPNLTIGPLVCEALRDHGITAPIDVHLMVEPVDRLIPDFAKAGANYITFHPEASRHVHRTLGLIRDLGCKAGLVFTEPWHAGDFARRLAGRKITLTSSAKFVPDQASAPQAVRISLGAAPDRETLRKALAGVVLALDEH